MSRTNFTSETLRLESNNGVNNKENDRSNNQHLQTAVINASQGYQKKKVSSFQITSIRPTSRSSNDGADDSENDTEDTSDILDSSRVTIDLDQETPSYSEDYSKSEDLLLGAGPVIPTSSQYGITALVQQTGTGGMMTARLPQGVRVNVTEDGLALAKADGGEADELDNWQKRFKIVKIDSNKPFQRGRWVCLDFMDCPAQNSSENKSEEVPNLVVSNIMLTDGDSNETQVPRFVQIPLSLSSTVQYPLISHPLPNQFTGQVQAAAVPVASSQVPPVQGSVHYAPSAGQPIQVVPPGFTGTQPQQGSVHPNTAAGQASTPSTSSSQSNIPSNVHSSSEVQTTSGVNTGISQGSITVGMQPVIPPNSVSSSHTQPSVTATQQSEQFSQAQGVNIPQNSLGGHINQSLPTQVIGITQPSAGIQQQQPSQQQPQQSQQQPISNQGIPASVSTAQQISQPSAAQMHQNQMQSTQHIGVSQLQSSAQQIPSSHPGTSSQSSSVASQLPSGSSAATSTIQAASYTSLPGTGATPTPATTPAQTQMSIASGQSSIQTERLLQIISQGGASQGTASSQILSSNVDAIPGTNQEETSASTTATPPAGAPGGSEEAESFHGLARALSNVSLVPHDEIKRSPASSLTASPYLSSFRNARPTTLLLSPIEKLSAGVGGSTGPPAGVEVGGTERQLPTSSASTASTVAIDNKIEQAMDLVKSHLMFAVREEVDVLKDRIVDLMDRIKHLECENTILKQYASPEVLQQLQSQMPLQLQQQQQPPHHSSTS